MFGLSLLGATLLEVNMAGYFATILKFFLFLIFDTLGP